MQYAHRRRQTRGCLVVLLLLARLLPWWTLFPSSSFHHPVAVVAVVAAYRDDRPSPKLVVVSSKIDAWFQQQLQKKRSKKKQLFHGDDNNPLSFLWEENDGISTKHDQHVRPKKRIRETTTSTTTTTTTLVGTLAKAFSGVLIQQQQEEAAAEQHVVSDKTKATTTAPAAAATTTSTTTIDMNRLLSACRVFEQSMMAVGQKQSARDLRGNIAKVQAFYKTASREATGNRKHGETALDMETVLRLEKQAGVHSYNTATGQLERLRDPSCAMGLLWIRRSISFQYSLFTNLLRGGGDDDDTPVSAKDAAIMAYRDTLQPYHGWALQKVTRAALTGTAPPTVRAWMVKLGGFAPSSASASTGRMSREEEERVRRDLRELLKTWKPLLSHWEQLYRDLDLEDARKA